MAQQVCNNAVLMCIFGLGTTDFSSNKVSDVGVEGKIPAVITDKPIIKKFQACIAPTNKAFAASLYTVPGKCTPQFSPVWVSGSPSVVHDGTPALGTGSMLMCLTCPGGMLIAAVPGQGSMSVTS